MKSLQILQSVTEFYKKRVKSLQMLQSLLIWQNFYKCFRICSAFKYCRVLKIVQMLQTKGKKIEKKCNVAEPTVVAELSKCCVASNVPNIAVPSNIAKCCRVL